MAAKAGAKKCVDNFQAEYADTVCRVGEVLLSFSSGILTVVTFGTGFWLQSRDEGSSPLYHFGLWQNCSYGVVDGGCKTLPLNGPSYLIAARLFMCLALMTGVCAWVISIIGLLQHKALWLFLATIGYAVQAVSMLLSLSSFAKAFSFSSETVQLGPAWSYSVGWLAAVLSILCAVYFLSVAMYRYKNPSPLSYPAATKAYAPLAQFESTETGSDDDDDL